MIIVPSDLLSAFLRVSANNTSVEDGMLIETLAFLVGFRDEEENLIATHLIFPKQEGQPFCVDDKGKQF